MPLRSCRAVQELTVDRRVFLREAVMGAGVVACAAGGLWLRCERSRSRIADQLVDGARPILDKYALEEQDKIPKTAAAKLRAFFDQICLNHAEFLSEIGTPEFRSKLKKYSPEARHKELLTVLYRRVPGAADIGEFIHASIREFGPSLDEHWSACCTEIAALWELEYQKENGPRFDAQELSNRATPMLRSQVEQAVRRARRVTDESRWRGAVRSFSFEALEVGPDIRLDIGGQTVRLPEFAVNASRHVFGKVLDYLGDPKWDCQESMTKRLALLGNETAAEFEKELRRRLNDLRAWRENAVRRVAEQHAAERVGFFGERQ